jgi:predicted TIM-barrel fold metal-dependent hydrolase
VTAPSGDLGGGQGAAPDSVPNAAVDLDKLDAIDVHVHVEQDSHGRFSLDQELLDASAKYFRTDQDRTPSLASIAEHYRARRIAAVVFTVDAPAATGHPALSSEDIADQAAEHPDVLIPFGSVDPHAGKAAVLRARRLVTEHGVRGFKFHPSLQAFEPNDVRFHPLYEALQELEVPALFHTGQTGIGAGLPGGRGIKLRYSAPMLLDDVAADFPHLTVVLAHPSVPWQDEAISIATHKANVYIDLSGWSPKYFPPQLVRAANGPLKDKMLFGSDFPLIHPDRWLRDFAKLEIKEEVRPLILKDNAARMLRLR